MTAPGVPLTVEDLSHWTPEDREALLSAVDESDYSLDDWLEALGTFRAWLEDRGETRRSWRNMTGYVHCCTLMASPGIALGNLKVIVFQALTEFGFESMTESQE
jgi:hypothetical protein